MADIETRAYVDVVLLTIGHFMLTSAPAVSNNMTASTLLLAAAYIKAVPPL